MLALGGQSFKDVPCRISPLSALDNARSEGEHIGLLGVDFFSRFDRIEVDFDERMVRFFPQQ